MSGVQRGADLERQLTPEFVASLMRRLVEDGYVADMGRHGDGWHEFRLPPSLAAQYDGSQVSENLTDESRTDG